MGLSVCSSGHEFHFVILARTLFSLRSLSLEDMWSVFLAGGGAGGKRFLIPAIKGVPRRETPVQALPAIALMTT